MKVEPLDVGGGKTISFGQLQKKLHEFVQRGLPTNANVVLITFADDAKVEGRFTLTDQQSRQKLQAAIGKLDPDGMTYMTKGLDLALTELNRLREAHPQR